MLRVAINGFGRIGRMVFRAGLEDPKIEFVALNDLTENKELAYLLKYDSAQPRWQGDVKATKDSLVINGKKIKIFGEKEPSDLPWEKLDVDIVVESTGFFTTRKGASKHLEAGAKKVLVSAPCKCDQGEKPVQTMVMGINEHRYDGDKIVSNASCTTNCTAPMVKILDEAFGIKSGLLTTVHAYTSSQNLVDAPHKKDPRRGRAAAVNMVPTTTGAAKAVEEVIPKLKGRLDGVAIRVPVPAGSITDLTVGLKKKTDPENINNAFKKAAKGKLKGILEYTDEPLVSSDIVGNNHSVIFDSALTRMIGGNFAKVYGWYDNEWGYSNRMIDMLHVITGKR
ncbi:type I glyceraldehyde-3-phosphate dehydrogenase [Candidatus Woesearchaeota archaeon]|nr:type I glyceraldehyde-3-phosphate dehydrogenase [Candidatus Woesearchaeota archaeon]